ncbi:hypothetical protein V6N13_057293 [Hibiscus sabdariffa]
MGLALVGMAEDRSKATLPLTIPRHVFKSSAKDSTRRSVEITLQGGTHDLSDARATPTTRALGGRRPLLRVDNRATGACVASSSDSDLEAFSDNPAHDVPPQPNSLPDNVFRPDRPAEAGLGSKKRGRAPLSIQGIKSSSTGSSFPDDSAKPVPLGVVSLDSRQGHQIPLVRTSSKLTVHRPAKAPEGAVSSPSPGRHAATRSHRGSSSNSAPATDGFGTGTPVPSPQSQSFSRGYGSILPTSLAYIVPSTRGCSPWRPDAFYEYDRAWTTLSPPDFQGSLGVHRTPRDVRCSSGRWTLPQTPWSVFQDKPDGEPAGRRPEHAGAEARRDGLCWVPRSRRRHLHGRIKGPRFGRHQDPRRSTPRADRRTGSRRSTSDWGVSPGSIRFPLGNFKHFLALFSKSFSSFPRGTCSLSVSRPYLALDEIYRPIRAAFPNNPTHRQHLVVRPGPGMTGLSPSPTPLSRGLGPGPPLRTLLQTTIRTPRATDSQAGLFPVRSLLLRESL